MLSQVALFFGLMAPSIALSASSASELINYNTLGHVIRLSELRSGNHDDSGFNDYYFEVKIYALASTQDERKMEFSNRKKLPVNGGRFGAIHIAALSFWEKTDHAPELTLNGETFRDLQARAMKEFSLAESEIAILIEVEMYENNKRFVFLGEDRFIGKAEYYLIPETFPHKPVTKNISLAITDNFGTAVQFDLLFKLNADPAAPASSAVD